MKHVTHRRSFVIRAIILASLIWIGLTQVAAEKFGGLPVFSVDTLSEDVLLSDRKTGQQTASSYSHLTNSDFAVFLPFVIKPMFVYLPTVAYDPPITEPYPPNNSERVSLNGYFTWEILSSNLNDATYTVYLEANNETPEVAVASNLSTRSYDPATFQEDTQYYWKIVATTPDGQSIESKVWTFRTDFFPEQPELGTMVTVPEGEFLMGCDPANSGHQCYVNQVPLHPVYLDAFEIDKFEVTNMEYRACVEAGACNQPRKFSSATRGSYFYNPRFDHYPVIYVSHWDAEDYCSWVGKRLPTEAEWEKTARGAIDTRPWPWGTEPFDCTRANHECTPRDTSRVDGYPLGQSPYGAMNMSGNVWEWVQDRYEDYYYSVSPYYNPVNTAPVVHIPFFSVRGGCFRNYWWYLRTSHRSGGHHGDKAMDDIPLFRSNMYGIRCARSITDEP